MSFSRAKLQRFNDGQSGTPSPADYNLPNQTRVAGAVILKTERFVSPATSDQGSLVSNSSVVFRTPNPPRKLKTKGSDTKLKPTELFQNEEHLKEKIVECSNKDQTIKELLEQLEEYRHSLGSITDELNLYKIRSIELQDNVKQVVDDKENSLKALSEKYYNNMGNLRLKTTDLNRVLESLKTQYEELKLNNKLALEQFLQELNLVQTVNNELIHVYEEKLAGSKSDLEIKQQQLEQVEGEYLSLCELYNSQQDNLKLDFELQVSALECKLQNQLSTVENELDEAKEAHKVNLADFRDVHQATIRELQAIFENEKSQLCADNEAKVKQLSENFNEATLLAEIQMKEKCRDIEAAWKIKLDEAKVESNAILKECQDIAEYNIIECELEKNHAVAELAELKQQLEFLKEANGRAQAEHFGLQEQNNALQAQLEETVESLEQTKAQCLEYVDSLAKAAKDKRTYELTITKTHQTVEALMRRLMKSDQDVEQLKAELEATESTKLQFEGKCNQLTDELDILFGLYDDNEKQNNLALEVCEVKIAQLEEKLHNEVENYKQEALKQVEEVKVELKATKLNLKDAMDQLHTQQELIINADSLITTSNCELERLERDNSSNEKEISLLTTTLKDLKAKHVIDMDVQYALNCQNEALLKENGELCKIVDHVKKNEAALIKKVQDGEEMYSLLESEVQNASQVKIDQLELMENYNSLLSQYEKKCVENEVLQKKVNEQESLIGPFREHLKAYELEYKNLINEKKDAENEAKEMGLKYAQLLGHQNQKQKIKHLMDLKLKNYELVENKKELENKIRFQSKTIDSLRSELSTVNKSPKCKRLGNKENMGSPNLSNRLDSPVGPLKERN